MRRTRNVCVQNRSVPWDCGNKRRSVSSIAALVVGATLACSSARAADVYNNIPYASPAPSAAAATQLLDLYVPEDALTNGTLPDTYTIILAHGGGYSTGDKADLAPICSALADLGFVVISANYRLMTSTTSSFPQPTCDILNVVHWVRSNGQIINLPQRVILGGFSAGSTIALNAAMGAGDPRFNVLPPAGDEGYTIDGAIGGFGRYDLTWNAQTFGMPAYVYQYLGVQAPVGPTVASWMGPSAWALLAQASAASQVGQCSPPTVLYEGDADALVPYGNSLRLTQAMNTVAAPVQNHVIPGGVHDYSVFGPSAQAQAQAFADAATWIAQHAQASCGRTAPQALDPMGVCCNSDGSCLSARQSACAAGWMNAGTCSPNPCQPAPPPQGSCCDASGSCTLTDQNSCASAWTAAGVCQPNPCAQPPAQGACCAPDGSCAISIQAACASIWLMNAACTPNICPQPPQGSCCAANGSCAVVIQSGCLAAWTSHGSCAPNPCSQPPQMGRCCAPSGACTMLAQSDCTTTWTAGGGCSSISSCPHPPPQGACCMGAICVVRVATDCSGGHSFAAQGTACNAPGNRIAPCCNADFNQDGVLQVVDIFAYLNAWFAGDPRALVSGNTAAGLSVQEIFDYLNAWFAGC
jgi:acetyl esterase/lipase